MAPLRLAGVELGGTKAIAILAEGSRFLVQETVPTTTPRQTLGALNAILRRWDCESRLHGLGIATFGPVCLDANSPNFACLLDTPKEGWNGARIAEFLTANLTCPWIIDTDVNAAALAEYHHGAGRGHESICYITIGTGVGGGLVINGRPVHGSMHPEIGHLCLRRDQADSFAGACQFHGDCIEGLVSGPALAARFGMPAPLVPNNDPRWQHVAADLGELVATLLLTVSANRVLFGGSVSIARRFMLPTIHNKALERLGNYLPFADKNFAKQGIKLAQLGAQAGPIGAIALASRAAKRSD